MKLLGYEICTPSLIPLMITIILGLSLCSAYISILHTMLTTEYGGPIQVIKVSIAQPTEEKSEQPIEKNPKPQVRLRYMTFSEMITSPGVMMPLKSFISFVLLTICLVIICNLAPNSGLGVNLAWIFLGLIVCILSCVLSYFIALTVAMAGYRAG